MFCFTKIDAIIFDLDDTLVHAKLDFIKMKEEIGCAPNEDILHFIEQLSCPIRREASANIVYQYELADAHNATIIDGALDFIFRAKQQNIPMAIVTRNCRDASLIKIRNNRIPIDLVMTREDARPKPDPEALLTLAERWQLQPHKIAYIGDYIYDIQAAHNASMQAWLFKNSSKNAHYESKLTYVPTLLK